MFGQKPKSTIIERVKSTKNKKSPVTFVRRYWLIASLIILPLLASLVFNNWYNAHIDQSIRQANASTSQLLKKADDQLVANAKLRAEAKAAREKAANEAADAARTANESTVSTINSSACNTASSHSNPANIDVLVNKKHCLQPLSYAPGDLVTSNGATLSAKAISAYNQLFAAAAAAGQGFSVTSSYRSYGDQVSTYNYWVSVSGKEGADTYSARPGYSEHQTGLAFDVAAGSCVLDCFGTTSQYQWLQANAADYGFIQRYYAGYENITGYKAEEWHYRYVGTAVAKDMQARGIKTLEQYWDILGGGYYY